MDLRDQAQQLIQELGSTLRLGDLALDRRDECVVVLDERIVMVMQLDEEVSGLLISTVLGQIETTTAHREELLFELLAGNYFWQLTRGGTIGLERDSGLLSLSYVVELPLRHGVDLPTVVAKLANASDYWLNRIQEITGASVDTGPLPGVMPGHPGLRV